VEMKSSLKESAPWRRGSRIFCREAAIAGCALEPETLGSLAMAALAPARSCCTRTPRAFEDGQDDALAVVEQGGEQVHGQDFRVAVLGGQGRGGLNGLLRLDGQLLPLNGMIFPWMQMGGGRILFARSASGRTQLESV